MFPEGANVLPLPLRVCRQSCASLGGTRTVGPQIEAQSNLALRMSTFLLLRFAKGAQGVWSDHWHFSWCFKLCVFSVKIYNFVCLKVCSDHDVAPDLVPRKNQGQEQICILHFVAENAVF